MCEIHDMLNSIFKYAFDNYDGLGRPAPKFHGNKSNKLRRRRKK